MRRKKSTEAMLAEALTRVISEKPELIPAATDMMDAWVRSEGRDPEKEKREAVQDLPRISDFY